MVAGHSIQVAYCCTEVTRRNGAVAQMPNSFLDFGCMGFARFFYSFSRKVTWQLAP
jgi:hypothetical protein